ncbi:Homoserine dehydrogenase [Altererythrobacter epoxidivorans]|uniref:Homoserine dehydrogenase n=1 Tax=Altererythrobacter epoxidivorans TaxID=361183 RepID=A0A0M5L3C1_9SPHN|nr:homoserine dehydrogenase [Altererythrobacter epoxidivorans]ALE17957.1 Homoserine dehydrogenase [Altererythrobacter epoxidivorans]
MAEPLRIALAGLGTVGAGVIRLIETNARLISARAGRDIVITAVSARDRTKDRGVDLAPYAWEDDMTALAKRDDVDVVVELVGGSDGPALALARSALDAGKALVTANKAMIAHHGIALAEMAEAKEAALKFEAAVAGGIPVVKGLREGTSANALERIYGILNGTCNYILSTMEDTGADFGEVLADAQRLGYAEADPTFDIEGIDAAHKLAILAAIGFGARIDFESVRTTGITRVKAADIAQAEALGFVIRLIAMTDVEEDANGAPQLLQRVRPCLVSKDHPLASVDGPTNAVVAEGNFSGRLLFQGAGAGDGPTASAVVADIIDIARDEVGAPFSIPVAQLVAMAPHEPGHRMERTYIRFTVADRPGVLAEITAAMRDAGVSIESLIQKGRADEGDEVLVAMVTHEGPERCIREALDLLDGSESLTAPPLVLPLLRD